MKGKRLCKMNLIDVGLSGWLYSWWNKTVSARYNVLISTGRKGSLINEWMNLSYKKGTYENKWLFFWRSIVNFIFCFCCHLDALIWYYTALSHYFIHDLIFSHLHCPQLSSFHHSFCLSPSLAHTHFFAVFIFFNFLQTGSLYHAGEE